MRKLTTVLTSPCVAPHHSAEFALGEGDNTRIRITCFSHLQKNCLRDFVGEHGRLAEVGMDVHAHRERLVSPPLLIGLCGRSWPGRWAKVSTPNGGHSVGRIDAATAQVSPLERRGEALDLPADAGSRRVGG